jgi:thioredoxin-related protein
MLRRLFSRRAPDGVAAEEAPAPGRTPGRRIARLLVEGLLVIAVVLAVSAWQARGHRRGEAPPLSLRTLEGDVVDSAALAGKATMIVFWAPWCGVCGVESANVSRVQRFVGDRARVVSVASEYDGLADIHRYMERHDVDYPVLLGGNHAARAWGVRGFPSVFFLDAEGKITGSVVGYTTTLGLLTRLLL